MAETQSKKIYPIQRGKLIQSKEGDILLLNRQGKAFNTNEFILEIWKLWDGNLRLESICSTIESNFSDKTSETSGQNAYQKLIKMNHHQLIEMPLL